MQPVVLIDVPPDVAPIAAEVAVRRCTQVLGAERCRPAAESPAAEYYALLRPDPQSPAVVVVQFHEGGESGLILEERRLTFLDSDAPESRWAAAGLVVAGMVTEHEAAPPAAPARPAPAPPPRSAPPPRKQGGWGLDALGLAGPGLEQGSYRFGGLLRGFHTFERAPALVVAADIRYALRPVVPRVSWGELGLGMGARFGQPASLVNADLIGSLSLERFQVSAQDPRGSGRATAAQLRFGGRLGFDVAVRVAGPVRLLIGADAAAMTPPVKVEVGGEIVGREPAARFTLLGGARFSL